MASEMLVLGGAAAHVGQARELAETAVADGRALRKWKEIIVAQGGEARFVDAPELLHPAPCIAEVRASEAGVVQRIETRAVGLLAIALGAGRALLGDRIDPAVGFEIFAKVGASVQPGEVLARVHARDADTAARFVSELRALIHLQAGSCAALPLVIDRIFA